MAGKRWTDKEIQQLKKYCTKGLPYNGMRISGRTVQAIRTKAKCLNINNKSSWTKEEDEALMHGEDVENRSILAIKSRKNKLGIKTPRKDSWTKVEDDFLYLNSSLTHKQLAKYLPNRTLGAISQRVSRLKVKSSSMHPLVNTSDKYITYVLWFECKNAYKIGATSNIHNRMNSLGFGPELIFYREFNNAEDCRNLERLWLLNVSEYIINIGLAHGNTETFVF